MFLNENVNPEVENFFNESEDFGGYAFGEAGIMSLNYQLSEEFHGTVEAMIAAEHSAIVNEDANLLSEAGNAFFTKISELFNRMAEGLQKIWNQVAKFFADKVAACQKKLVEWRLGKNAQELVGKTVTIKTRVAKFNGAEIGAASLKYAQNALKLCEACIKVVRENGGAPQTYDTYNALKVKKEVSDNTEEFRKALKGMFKIEEMDKKDDISYTVSADMIKFVVDYNAIVKDVKAAFKEAINKYKNFAKLLGVYAKEDKKADKEGYDKDTNANAVSARNARYISSKLNVALGVAVSGIRQQNSLAWAIISKAKGVDKKQEKLDKKLDKYSESTVLDRFAL